MVFDNNLLFITLIIADILHAADAIQLILCVLFKFFFIFALILILFIVYLHNFNYHNKSRPTLKRIMNDEDAAVVTQPDPAFCVYGKKIRMIAEHCWGSKVNHNFQSDLYSINNGPDYMEDTAQYKEFELYASKRSISSSSSEEEESGSVCLSTSESGAEDNPDASDDELEYTIRHYPHGVVINSMVYIKNDSWNTISGGDCAACAGVAGAGHAGLRAHAAALRRHAPLARHALAAARRIGNQYHCGVCNELFDLKAEDEHFSSDSHADNLLYAINKASDLDNYSTDENRHNDTYQFDSYRNENKDYHFNGNSYNDDEDHVYNESIWGDCELASNGVSYASIAKKPKAFDTTEFVKKDLGTRIVHVSFDSYHMIITPKSNRLYCMLCKDYYMISKAEHCSDPSHLNKLEKCRVVERFGEHFIRELDQHYHCGHCNNLVIKNDIEDHVQDRHTKNRNKNVLESDIKNKETKSVKDNAKNTNNVKNATNDSEKMDVVTNGTAENKDNDRNVNNDKVKEANNNDLVGHPIRLPGLTDVIVLELFGHKIVVSLMSYNVLLKSPNGPEYYCGLCHIICVDSALLEHVRSWIHIEAMRRTPILVQFKNNLIRAIRENIHCAICNVLVPYTMVYSHINSPMHSHLLSFALNPPPRVPFANMPHNAVQNNVQFPALPTPKMIATDKQKNDKNATETKITKETRLKDTPVSTKETNATEAPVLTEETCVNDDGEMNLTLNDSMDSDFDSEDYTYVKVLNAYFKISITAYNTLVHVGDGSRYCFVCSQKIHESKLKRHVQSRGHNNNIESVKFLDEFDGALLRQKFLFFHCATCNVVVSGNRELRDHLNWLTHVQEASVSVSVPKKTRKSDLKCGKQIHGASLVKRTTYQDIEEPETKVLFKARQGKNDTTLEKKMKVVILDGEVLKVDFENWHGIYELKGGLKCLLCQMGLDEEELANHVRGEGHTQCLAKEVSKEFMEHLIRSVNDTLVHCMICNKDMSINDRLIVEHISGKRHRFALDQLKVASSTSDPYRDCYDDVMQLSTNGRAAFAK